MRLAVALLVVLAACSTRRTPQPQVSIDTTGWPSGPTVSLGSHRVTFPNEDPATVAVIEKSITFWVANWERDEGRSVPPTRFAVVAGPVPVAGSGCWTYQGQWRGGDVVFVSATEDFTCPGTGHELYHRVYELPDHSDPRWWSWMQRQWQLLGYLERP